MRWCIGMLAAVLLLSGAARADEADTVKLIEKLGGKITRDEKLKGLPVITVSLTSTKVTDADLKELKELKQLTSLNLSNCQGVTDAAMTELKELKPLTELNLAETPVTGATLMELKDLKQLIRR